MNVEIIIGAGLLLVAGVLVLRPRGKARIDGARARALVSSGATLLDVRSPQEFKAGAIEGARNIPLGDLTRRLSEIPQDRPVVVHCRSGARSSAATTLLRSRGYQAEDLGPMSAW